MKPEISVEKSCYIAVVVEALQGAYAPVGRSGTDAANLFELQRAAMAAVQNYAEALWKSGVITYGDPTSENAAHVMRQVVKAIAYEADPKQAAYREERTYAAHLAREAAKSPTPAAGKE